MTDNQLVPLVTLAAELRCPIETLVKRFAGSIVLNEAGLRAISAERSRVYLAAVDAEAVEIHRAALAAAGERAMNLARLRVRAIKAQQEGLGEPLDGGALATMLEADGARDAQLDRAARDRAELMGQAEPQYHKIGD
jgi:hypothetical protein